MYAHTYNPIALIYYSHTFRRNMYMQWKVAVVWVMWVGAFSQSMRGSSFCRGGPTSDVERGSKYHYKRLASETPLPNIECWLGRFVRGSGPVLLRNPIFLGFSGGGVWCSPSGSAHAKGWVRLSCTVYHKSMILMACSRTGPFRALHHVCKYHFG